MVLESECRMVPSAADSAEVGESLRVVSCFMSDSVALGAVEGEHGPEHPDSGFKVASSATQRRLELIE
jgi:hypothetical protein